MLTDKRHLLLVDDDPDIREAMRDVLSDEGYETVALCDGQEALDYLRKNPPPPLILLDWNMAPMNGPQFLAAALEEQTLNGIPVILLTADAKAPDKSKTDGCKGYLVKPVDLVALFQVVRRYCGGDGA